MREEGISLYLISNMDFHMSEFVCDYFKSLEYMSGFTGLDAMMVVTEENAHLWTDERYRIQAEQELAGTGIELHVMDDRSDDIRTLPLFFEAAGDAMLDEQFEDGEDEGEVSGNAGSPHLIGFDGRTVPYYMVEEIVDSLGPALQMGIVDLEAKVDLVGDIWTDRPALPCRPIKILPGAYRDTEIREKLRKIREQIMTHGMYSAAVFTALDDIAWLFDFRGDEIEYSRTALSYAYVDQENAYLFIDSRKTDETVRRYLKRHGVTLREYNEFYTFLENVSARVLVLDASKNNFAVVVTANELPAVLTENHEGMIEDLKAIKTEKEISRILETHVRDGLAVTRFILWIRDEVKRRAVTELEAAEKLWAYRRELGAIKPSFETICAYGEHAAIVHYIPTEETDAVIRPKGLLLVDSGAHYPGGTTDVTRTIPMGPLTKTEKVVYTKVLASMLELCGSTFPEGLMDIQLDAIARKPLWDLGLEFDHATGHGVGYQLNVHEGPQSICWLKDGAPIELRAGMITSAEPGLYFEGEFGVRHENLMLCRASLRFEGFLEMAPITYVPIQTEAVVPELLTLQQLNLLNRYNELCYLALSGITKGEERKAIYEMTRPLGEYSAVSGPDVSAW